VLQKSPSHSDLLWQLALISHKWEHIGRALSVDNHIIIGLRGNQVDNMMRLSEILQAWIDKDEDVTWKTIIDAIEGPIVDNKAFADEIRQNLKHNY
jgi:hypothetical protein